MTGPALDQRGGWQEAVVSVRDLDRWSEALHTLFGWTVDGGGAVDTRVLRAWSLPQTTAAEDRILVSPSDAPRRLRLIRFDGVPQVQIRSSAMAWDTGGIFSLLVRVGDTDAIFAAAQLLGWSAYNDPVDMHFGGRVMRNVVLRAWDGVNFGLYQQTTPAPDAPPAFGGASAPFNGQQFVRALAPARDFYTKVLGWEAWFDGTTNLTCNNFGMPANFVGMPKKVAILSAAPDINGQVELVQWDGFTGRDLADRAVAPNLGILSLRIPVASVEQRANALRAAGATLDIPPTPITLPPYGEIMLSGLRAPDGTMIEIFGPP